MKRIVRLTESDLVKLVKRVVREQSEQEMMNATPVNMTAVGMDPKKAMEILAKNGFLWMTDLKTPAQPPYNAGIYKFIDNQGSTNQNAIKLGKNILNQIQSKGAKVGSQNDYIIDVITGIKPGAYSMYQKGQ